MYVRYFVFERPVGVLDNPKPVKSFKMANDAIQFAIQLDNKNACVERHMFREEADIEIGNSFHFSTVWPPAPESNIITAIKHLFRRSPSHG